MTDFQLRDPDGQEYVTGDAAERARLLAQGYTDADADAAPAATPPPRPTGLAGGDKPPTATTTTK